MNLKQLNQELERANQDLRELEELMKVTTQVIQSRIERLQSVKFVADRIGLDHFTGDAENLAEFVRGKFK